MNSRVLFNDEDIEILVNLLYRSENSECREFAKELDQLQQQDFEIVARALHKPDRISKLFTIFQIAEFPIRQRLIYIFGGVNDTEVLQLLISIARDEKVEIELRVSAIYVLANYQNSQVIELLINCLNNQEPSIRVAAAKTLGDLGDKRAVEPLLSLLQDKELTVRVETAWAFTNLKDSRAVEPLLRIMANGDEPIEVRRGAITALERIGDKRAIPVFVEALNSQDKYLQHISIEGLGNLGDEDIKLLLESLLEKDIPAEHKGQRRKKIILDAIAAIEARQSKIVNLKS